MGRKVVLISDVSGKEADESEFLRVVIRDHPSTPEAKALDILPGEFDKLKALEGVVSVEIGTNGEKKVVLCTVDELRKLVPDEVVVNASGTRGRPIGYSPKS